MRKSVVIVGILIFGVVVGTLLVKVAAALFLCYLVSWVLLAGVGLANNRTEKLLLFGKRLVWFIDHILAFPINLIRTKDPFFLEVPHSDLKPPQLPYVIILLNYCLQVGIILGGLMGIQAL
ncbi:MAG: hypothetical protein AAF135_00970 [Bacteroidota bacterium]